MSRISDDPGRPPQAGGDAFLAVDWGTTNLRAWVLDRGGSIVRRQDFPLGIGTLAAGEAARRFADTVRPLMAAEALPALLCGMIGSNLGWTAVPYLDCPVGFDTLSHALHKVADGGAPAWIVPGLRSVRPDGGPDVMRGEETHIFGWAAADPDRQRGEQLICHPGTHAKWARMVDGRIEGFVTAMTGELFALLRQHSSLRAHGSAEDLAAFDDGVAAAGDGGALASRLFTTRARVVGGDMASGSVESYLSGLLIGAEAAGVPRLLGIGPDARLCIVGDLELARRYQRALHAQGYAASVHDGEEAVLQGLTALFRQMDIAHDR